MGLTQTENNKEISTELRDFDVIIEIPAYSHPIKYEIDKRSGRLKIDRFLGTSMVYPCDYGFVPNTLSEDGDPVDVIVVSPFPIQYSAMLRCRAVGMLCMTDESGKDAKILAVPISKLTPRYHHIKEFSDLGQQLLNTIEHFFRHYKDLEEGKWVKIEGWKNAETAELEILNSMKRYQEK